MVINCRLTGEKTSAACLDCHLNNEAKFEPERKPKSRLLCKRENASERPEPMCRLHHVPESKCCNPLIGEKL